MTVSFRRECHLYIFWLVHSVLWLDQRSKWRNHLVYWRAVFSRKVVRTNCKLHAFPPVPFDLAPYQCFHSFMKLCLTCIKCNWHGLWFRLEDVLQGEYRLKVCFLSSPRDISTHLMVRYSFWRVIWTYVVEGHYQVYGDPLWQHEKKISQAMKMGWKNIKFRRKRLDFFYGWLNAELERLVQRFFFARYSFLCICFRYGNVSCEVHLGYYLNI